jgi:hypothetical protein
MVCPLPFTPPPLGLTTTTTHLPFPMARSKTSSLLDAILAYNDDVAPSPAQPAAAQSVVSTIRAADGTVLNASTGAIISGPSVAGTSQVTFTSPPLSATRC